MAPTTKQLHCNTCGKTTLHVLIDEQGTAGGDDFYAMYQCTVCDTNQPG